MTKAIINICPSALRRTIVFMDARALPKIIESFGESPYSWLKSAHITVDDDFQGEAVAEEMFDLTNNPSRQDEREEKYGTGQSVSSGDIVTVIGQGSWVCLSMGWAKLPD